MKLEEEKTWMQKNIAENKIASKLISPFSPKN